MIAHIIDKSLGSLEREGLNLYGWCNNCDRSGDSPLPSERCTISALTAVARHGAPRRSAAFRGPCATRRHPRHATYPPPRTARYIVQRLTRPGAFGQRRSCARLRISQATACMPRSPSLRASPSRVRAAACRFSAVWGSGVRSSLCLPFCLSTRRKSARTAPRCRAAPGRQRR